MRSGWIAAWTGVCVAIIIKMNNIAADGAYKRDHYGKTFREDVRT
jgi:hypothetical protein